MGKFEVKLPKMGESVAEATITTWLKEVGDSVDLDEAVVEIATDKVDSEVPSEVEGTLLEILFEKDAVVGVGETIAVIETEGEGSSEDNVQEKVTETKGTVEVSDIQEVEKTIEKAVEVKATPIAKTSD